MAVKLASVGLVIHINNIELSHDGTSTLFYQLGEN